MLIMLVYISLRAVLSDFVLQKGNDGEHGSKSLCKTKTATFNRHHSGVFQTLLVEVDGMDQDPRMMPRQSRICLTRF